VKESGYAGFPLPIDIYVKNKDEPRKIRFNYELILQERGSPPMSKVIRETYVFSPSEDFRRKLIKGGGVSKLFLHLHSIYLLNKICFPKIFNYLLSVLLSIFR